MKKSIEIMKSHILNILCNNNPTIYLYGSIVLNDFKLGWSDIDILCLTSTRISELQANQLLNLRQTLLNKYEDNLYFRSFEGAFLTLDTFLNHNPDTVVYWGTGGQKIKNTHSFDPFSTIELIDSGHLLYGNEIRSNLVLPSKEDIIQAVINHYDTIRNFALNTDRSLYSAGWLLDIARCIYTLRTGKIISKTNAGKWALANALVPDIKIMEKAILIREEPIKYKDDIEIMDWLESLGEYIQRFADVLEKEISIAKFYGGNHMTEREKMLNGDLYDCGDEELLTQWHKAKNLIRDYNNMDSENLEEKNKVLTELLGGRGTNLWITSPFYVDYGNNIYFRNNCEVNMNCTFLDDNKIIIGDNALIAPNVQIYTAFHPTNAKDRFGEIKKDGSFEFCKTQTAPVVIGDNVWIGGGVIIMPGVTIGDNVVIGAGSIVTKDIPSNKIAYGNPCKVVRDNI